MPDDRPIPQRMPFVGMCEAGEYHWCACGRSRNQPYCDGSHKASNYLPMRVVIQADRKVAVEEAVAEIAKITGQKPAVSYSRKAVSNFKLRAGEPVGARVTLRGTRMWEFLDRFINITCPNIRDFRGIPSRSFDGRGNYACGIADQSIFPEIELDKIKRQQGMDITIVTTAPTDAEALQLLKSLGMPFAEGR